MIVTLVCILIAVSVIAIVALINVSRMAHNAKLHYHGWAKRVESLEAEILEKDNLIQLSEKRRIELVIRDLEIPTLVRNQK